MVAEYSFEHIAKVTASNDDPTELSMEILDTTKQSLGYDTVRIHCDSRSALLTVLFNRIDEVNGIGKHLFSEQSNHVPALVVCYVSMASTALIQLAEKLLNRLLLLYGLLISDANTV